MSIFYVLPPRIVLRQRLDALLQSLLPGLVREEPFLADLAASLDTLLDRDRAGLHFVRREDLPDGVSLLDALILAFGAEEGDEVIEVCAGLRPGELVSQRWRLGASPSAPAA